MDSDKDSHEIALPRVLGLAMAIAVVVGNTIGSGIFVKPGRIAAEGGSFQLIFSVWALGTLLCILGGLCLAELSSMYPKSGGFYVYLKEAYGPLPAFLFGWQEFLFARPASTGALAVVCVSSISRITNYPSFSESTPWQSVPITILLIFGVAWLNVVGVIWGARLQLATTLIKVSLVLAIAVLPWLASLWTSPVVDLSRLSDKVTPNQPSIVSQFAAVLLAVMWAFNGWEGVVPISEEVKNPERNLPLALLFGIGILGVLYMGATLAYHAVLPMQEMVLPENREHVAEILLAKTIGDWGGKLMSIGLILSTFGTINSNLLTSPRVSYAMGRDGLLPKPFGRLHPSYRTPMTAILFQAFMASILVIASTILVNNAEYFRERSVFDLLTNCVVFAASLFYTAAIAALILLRRNRPAATRPFRTPGYPVTPIAYLIVYLWFMACVLLDQPFEALFGLLLILAGIPAFYRFTRTS